MKTLIKKTLLVLMVAFIAVFTLGVSSKVKAAEVAISFLTLDQRTSQSSTQQTWENDGLKMVNEGSVGNYYNPVRIYKNSTVTISNDIKFSSIIIVCGSNSYATALSNAIFTDATVSVSESTVTITPNSPTTELSFTNSSAQTRFKSLTVVEYEEGAVLPATIGIAGTTYAMRGDDPVSLTANITNSEITTSTWTSSDESVVTVNDGVVTILGEGKSTITATITGTEISASVVFRVYPLNDDKITIAKAREICEIAGDTYSPSYTVQGIITSIDTAYSESYDNVTVTISDDTDSIQLFRLEGGSELVVGNEVIATGPLTLYGTTYELYCGTYEKVIDASLTTFLENLDAIKAYMSLSYSFSSSIKEVTSGTVLTDTLDNELTGVGSRTTYSSWEGKYDKSSAVYAGQSAGDSGTIQLRTTNSNSGIVTTTSGGKVTKIVIKWNTAKTTNTTRTVDIYGSNTAYTSPTQLYSTGNQLGECIASAQLSSAVDGVSTITIEGEYSYVGLRSKSDALYLDSIEITWSSSSDPITTYDSEFRIKCGVDSSIANLDDIPNGSTFTYGIAVTCGTETRHYDLTTSEFKQVDEINSISYVVVSLGDVLTNIVRLEQDFTVRAYALVNETDYYYSLDFKTYSVLDMVMQYNSSEDANVVSAVSGLVSLLTELGKIQ